MQLIFLWKSVAFTLTTSLSALLCHCVVKSQRKLLHSSQSRHGGIYAQLHVISWPYLDIVSALTVGRHLLLLVWQCSTLCQMIYRSCSQHINLRTIVEDSSFSLPISTFSSLGVSHVMHYINAQYLLTYLPKSSVICSQTERTNDRKNDRTNKNINSTSNILGSGCKLLCSTKNKENWVTLQWLQWYLSLAILAFSISIKFTV